MIYYDSTKKQAGQEESGEAAVTYIGEAMARRVVAPYGEGKKKSLPSERTGGFWYVAYLKKP